MRNWIDSVRLLFEKHKREPVMPLATFIARNGGLELDSDVEAADFHKLYVPGAGPLARKSGKSIDGFWREALADAGFIERDADGYISRDIRNELFDLLHAEQKARLFGTRIAGEYHHGENEEFAEIEASIVAAVKHYGFRVEPHLVSKAALILWNGQTDDPLEAYEHAVMAEPEGEPEAAHVPAQAPRKPMPVPTRVSDDDPPF
jgi:hypothetical protein